MAHETVYSLDPEINELMKKDRRLRAAYGLGYLKAGSAYGFNPFDPDKEPEKFDDFEAGLDYGRKEIIDSLYAAQTCPHHAKDVFYGTGRIDGDFPKRDRCL